MLVSVPLRGKWNETAENPQVTQTKSQRNVSVPLRGKWNETL